jgi:general stress protein 26
MWATKDGWPVGVTHAFVWHDGKIWLTFAEHRHRTVAIRRDNRVSVNVSSYGYPDGANKDLPGGAITMKGTGEFFDDEETKKWFYGALSKKLNPENRSGEEFFYNLLDSPLRVILAITPVKKIMYNSKKAGAHMAGTISEEELGDRLGADQERMNKLREEKGLPPR